MVDRGNNAREALAYFEKLDEMFSTEGWKNLVDEAKAQLYQYQADAIEAPSWDRVCELRGQVIQLSRLVNLEEVTALMKEQAENQLLDEAADDAGL